MVYRNTVSQFHIHGVKKDWERSDWLHLAKQRKVHKTSLSLSQLIPTRMPMEGILMCSFLGIVNFYKAIPDGDKEEQLL